MCKTKVKVCGIKSLADIEILNAAMPDFAGFVFAKSKRQITFDQAITLKTNLNKKIKTVGVFVNEKIENIKKIVGSGVIDIVQIHGDENENYIKSLKEQVDCKIIKAIRINENARDTLCKNYHSDFILFDTYSKTEYGGTGKAFDWNLIKEYSKQFFLAGGLSVDNVINAINLCKPYCIDVSSGVEINGVKDKRLVIEFINKVRGVKND